MRVLVCGGRDYHDLDKIKETLWGMFDKDDTVTLIHGDARGADKLSETALKEYFNGGFEVLRFPADWGKYGKRAGPIRNQQMLDEGAPDLVVAFPGGSGTADMVLRAEKACIRTIIVEE